MMNIKSKHWIFLSLALTIAIGGCSSFHQQREEQKLQNAYSRGHWQRMAEGNWYAFKDEWANLTIEQLRDFIAAGVNINTRGKEGNTPLHKAVFSNNASVIKELIEAGADINARDNDGDTPFHYTVANNGNADVIKKFINAGADIHSKGLDGATPLHEAAGYNKSVGVSKELIKAGANVHAEDNYGSTPLHYAALYNGNVQVIKELVSAGANIHAIRHRPGTKYGNRTPCDMLENNVQLKNKSEAKNLLCR